MAKPFVSGTTWQQDAVLGLPVATSIAAASQDATLIIPSPIIEGQALEVRPGPAPRLKRSL